MDVFKAITDETITEIIKEAKTQLLLIMPALSGKIAKSIKDVADKFSGSDIVLILDSNEDAYRTGYGNLKGAQILKELITTKNNITVRSQDGLRLGLLIADDKMLFWSPTPKSVESERINMQHNGIQIDRKGNTDEQITKAVEPESSQSEIGKKELKVEEVAEIEKELKENPPAPIDLSQLAQVFSTKIQFVECTLHGAQWTEREIKVSNLLLNADVPEDFKVLFDTKIRPYSKQSDVAIPVHAIIQGQLAFDKDQKKLMDKLTQVQIRKIWGDIQKRYLMRLKNFGLLIRRADKAAFKIEVANFESILKSWVEQFREIVKKDEENLVKQICDVVKSRIKDEKSKKFNYEEIEKKIRDGLNGLRVIEPSVKIVYKNISWESIKDNEFHMALEQLLPPEDLEGWYSAYRAAPEK
ncbi:MAG: hypothetical protein J7J70_08980 [Deltaproteobacteria bacterium]|nr:hypothetical protein [Candidatus Tharpellaceae bacterium]